MSANFNFKKFISTTMTDDMYASALANFLSSKTEYAQERVAELADVLTMSPAEFDSFIEGLDSEVSNKLIPYFPDDDAEEAVMFKYSDVLKAYYGVEPSDPDLTPEIASKLANDLSSSTAAIIAGCVGIKELCNKTIVSSADLVAAVEAKCGGISDEMISTLSLLQPIMSSESMSLRDKLRNVTAAFGITGSAASSYTGFGPIHSTLYDTTGISGGVALLGSVGNTIVHVGGYVASLVTKVAGWVNNLFGGLLSKASESLSRTGSAVSGVTDATETRKEGDYSDFTCDNANFNFIIYPSDLESKGGSFLLSKLSHEYALHLTLGFGTLDMWYQGPTHHWINCVIHWQPCDALYVVQWLIDHAILSDSYSAQEYLSNTQGVRQIYDGCVRWLYEAETPEQEEQFLQDFSNLATSIPPIGNLGVSDSNLYCGIVINQCLFFAMLSRIYGYDAVLSAEEISGFTFDSADDPYSQRRNTIKNYEVARRAALTTTANAGSPLILNTNDSTGINFKNIMLGFIADASITLGGFDFGNPLTASDFLPYVYISSFCSGKYHILTNNELLSMMNGLLALVGVAVITLISIKVILSIKKKMWIKQASLDYKAFEVDLATNGELATDLYKQSVKLARSEKLLSAIVGSAKTMTSKAWAAITGIVNGVSGRIGTLVSTGDQDTPIPAGSKQTSVDDVMHVIKG